jgi:hypothetical protein
MAYYISDKKPVNSTIRTGKVYEHPRSSFIHMDKEPGSLNGKKASKKDFLALGDKAIGKENLNYSAHKVGRNVPGFLDLFKSFIEAISDDSKIIGNTDNVRNIIKKSKRSIPDAIVFGEFTRIYYDFASSVKEALDYVELYGNDNKKLFDRIRPIADDLYKVFNYGEKITDKCQEYDRKGKECKEYTRFIKQLDKLDNSVDSLEEYIFKSIKNEVEYAPPDNDVKGLSDNVTLSIVKGHWSR